MKRKITKDELVEFIKELDTRCTKWDEKKINRALNGGFAELATVVNPFSSELVTDLNDYYEFGELNFTINLPSDATSVYDLYLVKENKDKLLFDHGEAKVRNVNFIYRDPQNVDMVHVSLEGNGGVRFDNAVVKYFYIPKAEGFDQLYVSGDVYIALESALSSYVYNMLHDVEKSGQQRTAMQRLGASVAEVYPEDYGEPGKASMFPPGV